MMAMRAPALGVSSQACMPSEPKRSKVCAVCGAISEHFYLNYGAAVCFSCRAFFRRTFLSLEGKRSEVSNPRYKRDK